EAPREDRQHCRADRDPKRGPGARLIERGDRSPQRLERSGRKNARTSSTSAFGSSSAAKWPPLGKRVQRSTRYMLSAHLRGGRTISFGKIAHPVGTSTRKPVGGNFPARMVSQYRRQDEFGVAVAQ